jgi:hypothetical protein
VAILVADDGVMHGMAAHIGDVVNPRQILLHGVAGQGDDLHSATPHAYEGMSMHVLRYTSIATHYLSIALGELSLQACHVAELGGAHRGECAGVREDAHPLITSPRVEVDLTLGGVLSEVGGDVADAEGSSGRCRHGY